MARIEKTNGMFLGYLRDKEDRADRQRLADTTPKATGKDRAAMDAARQTPHSGPESRN
ncbi:hypothetical protein J2S43_006818 [Catenuloplanes nepalensis]|uniref:Uncharacterized protein n=1 Tax=Catenuloplanes nepalensis TaxID=587533 RepID=A0ABT9N4W7_9ACTN|nr:hypothetical protein [Catenuloplanes nepalensis]MDP9798306.1 hypothetical protein [Catenuloplanes nepalensis]